MSFQTQTFRGSANLSPATDPLVTNLISPASPSTEFSHTFRDGTKMFIIRNRGTKAIQYAYASGESGTNYVTIPGNASLSNKDLFLTGVTIYMQVNAASNTIEIEEWI